MAEESNRKCQGLSRVRILSPLQKGNGNFTTVSRIRGHLTGAGYACDLEDPAEVTTFDDFRKRLDDDHVDILIGIHALRTGPLMKASGRPYILILGGTDINVFCHDIGKMAEMTDAVHKASFVVCFSESNRDRALELWPHIPGNKLCVIPQAVQTSPSQFSLTSHLQEHHPQYTGKSSSRSSSNELNIFLLVAGIRSVKNPLYLVDIFQEWHSKDPNVIMVVLGHKLDKKYFSEQFEPSIMKSPGVVYIPGLSMSDTHSAMTQSVCVLNTSDNEGMCISILEAMHLQVPVIVRDIPANRAIVEDGKTGFLFDSPQTFLSKAKQLLMIGTLDARQFLVRGASRYVQDHHHVAKEELAYVVLVQCCDGNNNDNNNNELCAV